MFENVVDRQARLAQSVEHETLNLGVVGSSPTLGEFFRIPVNIIKFFLELKINMYRNLLIYLINIKINFFKKNLLESEFQIRFFFKVFNFSGSFSDESWRLIDFFGLTVGHLY